MATLKNPGKLPDVVRSVLNREYTTNLQGTSLTAGQVDTSVDSQLTPYAAQSYVDAQDLLNATASYIDVQDNLRIKLTQKEVANGAVLLDANGKIAKNRFSSSVASSRPKPYARPTAYSNSGDTIGAVNVATASVANPGYAHKLLCWGTFEATSSIPASPIVTVRIGSTSGPIIGRGVGGLRQDAPAFAGFMWSNVMVIPHDLNSQTTQTAAARTAYVMVQSDGNGSGTAYVASFEAKLCIIPVPV